MHTITEQPPTRSDSEGSADATVPAVAAASRFVAAAAGTLPPNSLKADVVAPGFRRDSACSAEMTLQVSDKTNGVELAMQRCSMYVWHAVLSPSAHWK